MCFRYWYKISAFPECSVCLTQTSMKDIKDYDLCVIKYNFELILHKSLIQIWTIDFNPQLFKYFLKTRSLCSVFGETLGH